MSINFLLTSVGKHTMGRLRPHFLDVCRPNLTLVCADPYAYVTPDRLGCTGDAEMTRHARLSFPSGHTSFAFYTMVYLIVRLWFSFENLFMEHFGLFVALLASSLDLAGRWITVKACSPVRLDPIGSGDWSDSHFGLQASLGRRIGRFHLGHWNGFYHGMPQIFSGLGCGFMALEDAFRHTVWRDCSVDRTIFLLAHHRTIPDIIPEVSCMAISERRSERKNTRRL